MARTQGHGNPNWTRDETILALELYLDREGVVPSPRDPAVIALSGTLRSLPYHSEAAKRPSFRNPDGVGFKLMNLRQVATGRGLGNVSQTDRDIWAEFGNDLSKVKALGTAIRAAVHNPLWEKVDELETEEFWEGALLTQLHYRRERHRQLRTKLLALHRPNGLKCEMCSLARLDLPIEVQEALFEAHHLLPLSAAASRSTKLSDVALLCACCHRLLHKMIAVNRRWFSPADCAARMFPR